MSHSKYIMIEWMGIETPILFPAWVQHADIASAILRSRPGCSLISAGFFSVGDNQEVSTFGHSQSLNLNSREEDARFIAKLLQ